MYTAAQSGDTETEGAYRARIQRDRHQIAALAEIQPQSGKIVFHSQVLLSVVRAGLVADPIVAGPHVHERLIRLGVIAAYLLVLVFSWNEYFMAVNLTSANAQTMPILIFNQSTGRQLAWWTMAAMATTSIAPMIVIGLVLEKYIVAGLQAGALKG